MIQRCCRGSLWIWRVFCKISLGSPSLTFDDLSLPKCECDGVSSVKAAVKDCPVRQATLSRNKP